MCSVTPVPKHTEPLVIYVTIMKLVYSPAGVDYPLTSERRFRIPGPPPLPVERVDSEIELSEVHQLLTSCMSKAGMPLQDWNSNSPVFNSKFSEDNRKICPTVLGISWNTHSDTLSIKPVIVPKFKQLAKRKALSICSQVYDPLGLLSPVTVKSKIFLQELWKDSKGWDEPLNRETIETFNGLVSEYRLLDQLQFPRMVSSKSYGCRLHVFCDAQCQSIRSRCLFMSR